MSTTKSTAKFDPQVFTAFTSVQQFTRLVFSFDFCEQSITVQDFVTQIQINQLYQSTKKLQSQKLIEQLSQSISHCVCGAVLKNAMAVHCDTCSFDPTSIFCIDCFEEDKHVGHNYQFKLSNGMCDCGYRHTVAEKSFCKKHYGSHIMKKLDSYKQQIDLQNCAAYVYLMFGGFLLKVQEYYTLLKQNSQIINKDQLVFLTKQIGQFFYQYPIDPIRRIITNMLFMSLSQITSVGCLLEEKEIDQMICPFVDIDKMVHDFQSNERIDQYPIIAILSHLERIFNYESIDFVEQMTHYLVDDQISEPTYRVLFMYLFHLKNNDIAKQYLYYIENKVQNSSNPSVTNRPIFAAAQVQLFTNFHMYNKYIYLFSVSELCALLDVQLKITQDFSELISQEIHANFIQNICQQGMLQMTTTLNQNDLSCFCLRNIQQVVQQYKLNEISSKSQFIQQYHNLKYINLPEIRACRSVNYTYCQNSNILTAFLLMVVQYCSGFIKVYRVRDLDTIQGDVNILNHLVWNYYDNLYFSRLSWSAYTAAFEGAQDNMNLDYSANIVSTCDDFTLNELKCAKNNARVIFNVVYCALFLVLTQSIKVQNQYVFDINTKFPEIPCGHGLHVYKPLIQSDKDTQQPIVHHLYCTYIPYISLLLNCQQQRYSLQITQEHPHDILRRILLYIDFAQQLSKYNLYIFSAFCIRTLVSYGLFQMNGFIKLATANEKIKLVYSADKTQNYEMQIYHYFYVLQQIIQIMPTEKFLFQFFEAYGFADPETGEFVDRFQKTDPEQNDKMLKLLQVMIVHLMCLIMNDLSFKDPFEYQTKHVLQVFFLIRNPTRQQIHKLISCLPFYNSQTTDKIMTQCSNKICALQKIYDVYSSKQQISYHQLNHQSIQAISLFDPFLFSVPQFLFTYEQYAKDLKLSQKAPFYIDRIPYLQKICQYLVHSELFQKAVFCIIDRYCNSTPSINQQDYDILISLASVILISKYIPHDQFIYVNNKQHTINSIIDLLIEAKNNGKTYAVLEDGIDFLAQSKNDNKKRRIDIKSKLSQIQEKNKMNTTTQLLINNSTVEHSQSEPSASSADSNIIFVKQLQIIQEFASTCSICCSYMQDSPLGQYCSYQMENLIGQQNKQIMQIPSFDVQDKCLNQYILQQCNSAQQFYVIHSCTHITHYQCSQKNSDACPMCRQSFNVLLPVVEFQQRFSFKQLENVLLKMLYQNVDIDSSVFETLNQISLGNCAIFVLNDLLNDEQLAQSCSNIYSSYIQQLVSFFMSNVELNIQQYYSKSAYDIYSSINQKEKMYRDLINCSSSLCLIAYQLFQFIKDKFDSQLLQQNIMDCLEAHMKFRKLILLNQKFQPSNEIDNCYLQIRDVLDMMIFDNDQYNKIQQDHERNCNILLLNQEYRYLLSEELKDSQQFYIALRYAKRCEYLQNMEVPFKSEEANIYMNWPYKLNLQQYFAKDFVSLMRQNSKMKCNCGKQQIIICLYCGQHYCQKCFTQDIIQKHKIICESNGVWFSYLKNIIFFVQKDKCFFSGAPYLDNDKNDDCERQKNVTLFLNGELLCLLQRTMLWKLDYKMSEQALGLAKAQNFVDRILQLLKSWFGQME